MIATPRLQHHRNGLALPYYSVGVRTIGVWQRLYAPAPSHLSPTRAPFVAAAPITVDIFQSALPAVFLGCPTTTKWARRIPRVYSQWKVCYPSEAGVAVCLQLGGFMPHEPGPGDRDHGAISLPLVAMAAPSVLQVLLQRVQPSTV